MVPGPGEAAAGKKTPALTVQQMREVFVRLLQPEPPSPQRIAEEVSRVLRNEEARIYHWHKATGAFPPRRGLADGYKRVQSNSRSRVFASFLSTWAASQW